MPPSSLVLAASPSTCSAPPSAPGACSTTTQADPRAALDRFEEFYFSLPLAGDADFTPENVLPVLLATASIPLVLNGVSAIPGAPAGLYRDGGLTDYHLANPLTGKEGIVLYPHFLPQVVPGWFDKSLSWRQPLNATRRLADEFHELVSTGRWREVLRPLRFGKGGNLEP